MEFDALIGGRRNSIFGSEKIGMAFIREGILPAKGKIESNIYSRRSGWQLCILDFYIDFKTVKIIVCLQ